MSIIFSISLGFRFLSIFSVFESIKNFPLSIIVIDNYELAHKDVINIIYKILETGELKLSNNTTTKFNLYHRYAIYTTNSI